MPVWMQFALTFALGFFFGVASAMVFMVIRGQKYTRGG